MPSRSAPPRQLGDGLARRIAQADGGDQVYRAVAPESRAMRLAEDLFQRFADQIEVELRRGLAIQLQACKFLPRKLASAVADDVQTAALPRIALADLAADGGVSVTSPVPAAAEQPDRGASGRPAEVVVLADVGEGGKEPVHLVIEIGGDRQAGPIPPVERLRLSLDLVQKTAGRICETLRRRLIERHGIPETIAGQVIAQSAEQVWTDLISSAERPAAVALLADRLHAQDRLTPTVLLRAVFHGQVDFFDAGLAALAGIEPGQVRALVSSGRPEDYKAVYRWAGLPPVLYRAFRAGIEVVINGDPGGDPQSSGAAQVRSRERGLIARLISDYQDLGPQSLEAILSRLSARV